MKSHSKTNRKKAFFLLLAFCAVLILLSNHGLDRKIKQPVVDSLSPVLEFSHTFIIETKKNAGALLHFYRLRKNNETLEARILELEKRYMDSQEIRAENTRLRALLDYRSALQYQTVPAQIIGQDTSNFYGSVLINKGTRHQIQKGQAVLCPEGYVGKVVEVFDKSSKVLLVTDKSTRIGAMIKRSRDRGILHGQNNILCQLNFLPRNSDIHPGDFVITSGMGGLAPKEILLGEITSIHEDESGLYQIASMMASVNFSKLEEVLVVIGTELPIVPQPENPAPTQKTSS